MSLTSHLRTLSSPVRRFFEDEFPYMLQIERNTKQHLAGCETIVPTVADRSYPWSVIGTAFDYRIRYYFGVTPAHALVAWDGAAGLAGGFFPTIGNTPLLHSQKGPFVDPSELGDNRPAHALASSFFSALELELARICPVGQRLAQVEEDVLTQYCWVLALYENIYRSGQVAEGLVAARDVEGLLALAPSAVKQDLRQLAWAFYDGFHDLLLLPRILNPTFDGSNDVGGADADLIVDGCLLEIKTTKNPRLEKQWLYQLLGYVLLDYTDRHQIRQVGIYYARQTKLVRWDVDALIRELSGDRSIGVATLRDRFRKAIGSHGRAKRTRVSATGR